MSIFRDTLPKNIRGSLEARQEAMTDRTPQHLQYLNTRNAWIKMTSAVNVNGSADLARKYVLHGGTLNPNGTFKTGIGTGNELYSTTSPGGKSHRLGIRPMPGITSMDVKSKTAYGSLREITVNFQCWDIRQLEDLEQLYMRPFYTVLIEWGWTPYIGPDKKYYSTYTDFFSDELLNPKGFDREEILQALYKKCDKYGGNYDAVYGYVKNYQWSAREDGGYDCKTIIVSTGELIESLKVNYVRADLAKYKMYESSSVGDGFLNELFDGQGSTPSLKFADFYQKNTAAGVWAELALKLTQNSGSVKLTSEGDKLLKNKFITPTFPGLTYYGDLNQFIQPDSKIKAYITLEAAFDIMNKYIIAKSKKDGKPLARVSTTTPTYHGGKSENLLCVAHPVQVSVDPTTCLIKSPLWYDRISPVLGKYAVSPPPITPPTPTTPTTGSALSGSAVETPTVTAEIFQLNAGDAIASINILKELQKDFFTDAKGDKELGIIGNIYISLDFLYRLAVDNGAESSDTQEKNEINLYTYIKNIANNIQTALGSLTNFEVHVDPVDNIIRIVDINYNAPDKPNNLFKLEVQNLNSIVRSYSLQSQIFPAQTSLMAIGAQSKGGQLGIQNNTMIDFNKNLIDRIMVSKEEPKGNSVDKSNKKEPKLASSLAGIVILFGILAKESASQTPGTVNIDELLSKSKNALRDLITFFQNLPGIESPGKNRNIIPTKFSFEMDGIGGIVIGSLFDMNRDFIPEGYKGGKIGSRLAQTVTGIQHTISNSDWRTKIDTMNVILDRPDKGTFNELNIEKIVTDAINALIGAGVGKPAYIIQSLIQGFQNLTNVTFGTGPGDIAEYIPGRKTGGTSQVFNGQLRKNGEIEDLLVDLNNIRPDLYKKHNVYHSRDNNRIRLQAAPMAQLIRLLEAATADGLTIKVINAFRSYQDQVWIWNTNCSNAIGSGKCKTRPGICCPAATPGTSNHGWGLALDLTDNNGKGLDPITNPTYWAWMQANQKKFGFKNCNDTNESHHYDYLGPLETP